MGLKERIQADMQKAAKERNSLALSALRMALAAIKNKEIEERGEIGEDSILKVLATMVKQRKESIDLFRRGGGTRRRKDRQRDRSAPACRVAGTGRRLFPGGCRAGDFFPTRKSEGGPYLGRSYLGAQVARDRGRTGNGGG